MTEFIDRNGIKRRVEFSPSFKKGWVKLTIDAPEKKLYADTYEMPESALQKLIDNLTNLKEESND